MSVKHSVSQIRENDQGTLLGQKMGPFDTIVEVKKYNAIRETVWYILRKTMVIP